MAKVIYSAAMSLDGFIAGPDGDMSWLRPYAGPNPEVDELQKQVRALLVGNRTFHGDDPNKGTDQEGAYGGTWSGPSFVLTHDVDQPAAPDVTYVGDLATALGAARSAAGEGYVNVLGADVGRQCLEAGELDEVLVVVLPVLLGDGTRLFAVPGGRSLPLEPLRVTELSTGVNLRMRVPRRAAASPAPPPPG